MKLVDTMYIPIKYRISHAFFIGAVVSVIQLIIYHYDLLDIDIISLGMAILSSICCIRTIAAMRIAPIEEEWRWRAAVAGWVLWVMQWATNTMEIVVLDGDQRAASAIVLAERIAFLVAIVPLSHPNDLRAFRIADISLSTIAASLLSILSWPEIFSGYLGQPNTAYLYLSYVTMVWLVGMGLLAQRTPSMRKLAGALLGTLAAYGSAATILRELYHIGSININSPWFLLGNLAFVTYLALLPVRTSDPGNASQQPASPIDNTMRTALSSRIVPLSLTVLIVGLSFPVERVLSYSGIIAGLCAVIVYAGRTMLVEKQHLDAQKRVAETDRIRLSALLDLMHEVRAPLGVVSLNASLLLRRSRADADENLILCAINKACDNVVQLLEKVLSLERVEAGLVVPVIAKYDVAALVREVTALLEVRWRSAGVIVRPPGGSVAVEIDGDLVRRILINLVENAVRFTPRGGTVDIAISYDRQGRLTLRVADTGAGMSQEMLGKLFQRFAVVGQPVHGQRGTGLGLAISLALARTMDGIIDVASTPGLGTTMTLVVPQHGSQQR